MSDQCVVGMYLGTDDEGFIVYVQRPYEADFAKNLAQDLKMTINIHNEAEFKANLLEEMLGYEDVKIYSTMPENHHTFHLVDTRDWTVALYDTTGQKLKIKWTIDEFLARPAYNK